MIQCYDRVFYDTKALYKSERQNDKLPHNTNTYLGKPPLIQEDSVLNGWTVYSFISLPSRDLLLHEIYYNRFTRQLKIWILFQFYKGNTFLTNVVVGYQLLTAHFRIKLTEFWGKYTVYTQHHFFKSSKMRSSRTGLLSACAQALLGLPGVREWERGDGNLFLAPPSQRPGIACSQVRLLFILFDMKWKLPMDGFQAIALPF